MTASLHLIDGPAGAGKSAYARKLAAELPALGLCRDLAMADLFTTTPPAALDPAWLAARLAQCEAHLWSVAESTLAAGDAVVLDLGPLQPHQRQAALFRARGKGATSHFHQPAGPLADRWARVQVQTTPHPCPVTDPTGFYAPPTLDELVAAYAMAL